MPYYHWHGVMLDASYCKGMLFASGKESLKKRLLEQEIALISCRKKRCLALLPISLSSKIVFFQQLHDLLDAGIHIHKALCIISQQTTDMRFADIVQDIASYVDQGKPLHKSLQYYKRVFSSEMVHITDIGAEAGNLPIALKALCNYLQETQAFKKQLRAALLLPFITFGFFFIMLFIVLFAVVPRYAQLFASMGKEVPSTTRFLIRTSGFIGSYYVIGFLFIIATSIIVLLQLSKQTSVKQVIDRNKLYIPYIGALLKEISLVQFLRSTALLLQGGMHVVPALQIAQESMQNVYIKQQVKMIIDDVKAGQTIGTAMQSNRSNIFAQDIISLITVGEETAHLPKMIARAADIYQHRVQQKLTRYALIAQPASMIILGLLVAGLIFAIYMPLFNLADLM